MTEHQIQSAFIQWVRIAEKQDERLNLLFHPANGGKRNIITAVRLKQLGTRPGIPDVMLPIPMYCDKGLQVDFYGLAIEFKTAKGKASQAQSDYMDLLTKYGWLCVICTTPEAAIQTVKDYLR